jgi:hypothetical protein
MRKTVLGVKLKAVSINPLTADQAVPARCALTTKTAVDKAICQAIQDRYSPGQFDDNTDLGDDGLGFDDIFIKTDLYGTVVVAVHDKGCRLLHFGPADIASCKTVGDVVTKVWADLSS